MARRLKATTELNLSEDLYADLRNKTGIGIDHDADIESAYRKAWGVLIERERDERLAVYRSMGRELRTLRQNWGFAVVKNVATGYRTAAYDLLIGNGHAYDDY